MLVSDNVRKSFHWLGFNKDGESFQIRPFLVNALCLVLCTSSFMVMFTSNKNDNADAMIARVLAAKDVNVLLTTFGFSMDYTFVRKNLETLMDIVDKSFSKYQHDYEDKQKKIIAQRKTSQLDLLRKTSVLLFIIVSILTCLPAVVTTYIVFTNGIEHTNVKSLPMPLVFWYPEPYDTLKIYMVVYIFQAVYFLHLLGHIYCMYGSVISSIQAFLIDIELLCTDLNDIDDILLKYHYKAFPDALLRDYMNYLIKCHQNLLRNIRIFNGCVSLVTTLGNQCVCFQLCIFLYCIAEIDNKVAKFGYFCIALSEALVLFIYCYNGQKIINGNEDIRRHLYHCSWLNKPRWFKRDLLIMMSMADTPMHVKPFGLYILNLNNFTNIMNAAYSYFNMLRTLHK